MELKCDEPLSNFAFNFNLRRYNPVISKSVTLADEVHVFDLGATANGTYTLAYTTSPEDGGTPVQGAYATIDFNTNPKARAAQVDSIKTRVESAYGISA